MLAGLEPARARRRAAEPADRHRRLPAAGARAPPGRDGARLPGPAYRRRGRAARPGRRHRGARRRARRAPTTPTPTALERWLALGGADLDERAERGRRRPRAGRRPRCADDRAVRRAGRPGRPGVAAAEPVRHLPARRADQRPRPRRPRPAGAVRRRRCAPAPCWSATTASSWPARCTGSSSWTSPSSRSATTAAATRPTSRSARSRAGTPARSTSEYADTRATLRGAGADAARLDGEGRAQRPAQAAGQRQVRPQLPRRGAPRSRPPRPARPSG